MSAKAEGEAQTGTTVLQDSLDDVIERLESGPRTEDTRSLLYEARRLRAVLTKWQAIAPTAEARREMLARVLDLASSIRGVSPPSSFTHGLASTIAPTSGTRPAPTPHGGASARGSSASASSGSSSDIFAIRRTALGPGAFRVRPSRGDWVPMPATPGVAIQRLHVDRSGERQTAMIRMDPGASLPRHRHASDEDLYVLEGSVRIGGTLIDASDYCHSDAGSVHDTARSDGGCVLLVIGSTHDDVLVSPSSDSVE